MEEGTEWEWNQQCLGVWVINISLILQRKRKKKKKSHQNSKRSALFLPQGCAKSKYVIRYHSVFKCVYMHGCVLSMTSTWYDLQQQHEFEAISEILFNVLNLCPGLPQVGVTPSCEGLKERRDGGSQVICTTYYTFAFTDLTCRARTHIHHTESQKHTVLQTLHTQFDASPLKPGSQNA